MMLTYKCEKCKSVNNTKLKIKDRGQYYLVYESSIVKKCLNCNHENKITPNNIKAVESNYIKLLYIFAILISLFLGYIVYNYFWDDNFLLNFRGVFFIFGLVIIIPFIIAGIVMNIERKAIKKFNNYYV